MKGPEKVSDWTCERAMVKITILKKPAAAPYKRPAANPEPEEPMSLEEKMELFQGSKTQDLNSFLGTLTRNQREALWKKFERARGSTKDPKVEEVWNTVCKGKNSDQHKKQLLKVFLQTKGELKNSQAWQKEVLSLQQTSGSCFFLLEALRQQFMDSTCM